MGITRSCVSAKLDEEVVQFLDAVCRNQLPFDVSRSAAINLSLAVLLHLLPGELISAKAKAMQEVLGNLRDGVSPALPESKGTRVLLFDLLLQREAEKEGIAA